LYGYIFVGTLLYKRSINIYWIIIKRKRNGIKWSRTAMLDEKYVVLYRPPLTIHL